MDLEDWVLSDEVADEVNRLRREAGMNREQLGARCAELGLPLTADSIANIETGRRDRHGRRRREITVDELVVLALALKVSPLELAIPLGSETTIDFPGAGEVERWRALRWFAAEGPLDDEEFTDPRLPQLFREHYRLMSEMESAWMRAGSARNSLRAARAGENTLPFEAAAEFYDQASQAASVRLVEVRRIMRANNVTPPDLGWLKFIETEEPRG